MEYAEWLEEEKMKSPAFGDTSSSQQAVKKLKENDDISKLFQNISSSSSN